MTERKEYRTREEIITQYPPQPEILPKTSQYEGVSVDISRDEKGTILFVDFSSMKFPLQEDSSELDFTIQEEENL
jgi:hypothetical protein